MNREIYHDEETYIREKKISPLNAMVALVKTILCGK